MWNPILLPTVIAALLLAAPAAAQPVVEPGGAIDLVPPVLGTTAFNCNSPNEGPDCRAEADGEAGDGRVNHGVLPG